MFKVVLSLFIFYGAWGQQNVEPELVEDGFDTSGCVFGCIGQYQRKGVQESGSVDTTPETPVGSCNGLNMESIEEMCSAYLKAEVCLGHCSSTETKKVITTGLNYVCIERIEDYRKYAPCYKKQCPVIAEQCGGKCGSYSDASDQWLSLLGVQSQTNYTDARRKRQSADAEKEAETESQGQEIEYENEEDSYLPKYTCRFLSCHVNCSQPLMETECGKEAFELMKHTSNILLSFLVVPLEQSWLAATNATQTDKRSNECSQYLDVAALTARESAASQHERTWSMLLVAMAFLILRRVE